MLMGLSEQQDMLVSACLQLWYLSSQCFFCCLLQVDGPLPGGLVLPGMSGSERKQLHTMYGEHLSSCSCCCCCCCRLVALFQVA
jgi:hypothetical protein